MSSEINHEDGLEKLKESVRAFDAVKNAVVSPQLQQIANTMQMMNNAVVSAIQSDAMRTVIDVGNRITELISSINFVPVLKGFSEALIPIKYINLLERLKWPVFLIDDDTMRQDIMAACSNGEDIEAVKKIIFSYCTDSFLESMEKDWNDCGAITATRKPVLSEAILMHKQGYYYASTSMLMCQVYGVASDIVDLAKTNGLEVNDETKDFVSEYFKIKREDVDKEKGKLMQMVVMTESGMMLWDAMASYLQSEILCSSESKKRWATQPLRNKICHGDQLNFGTKEHSLKAILTIDMLIQLAYEIKRITEIHKSEESTEEIDANK